MAISISRSHAVEVGQVFTPLPWAEWLINRWGIFEAWLHGATVCDPTAGQGSFALALFSLARKKQVEITGDLLSRITLIELYSSHLDIFKQKARLVYGIEFPSSQLLVRDVAKAPPRVQFDILVGNPPWANFTDLPDTYKEELKPYFVAEGLVPDRKRVLLGTSRTDIAALILEVVLGKLLRKNGIACFFVPLSLFTGDDAHRGFRDYVTNQRSFAVEEVYEFNETRVFDGIGTSYCSALFRIDKQQVFPVVYFRQYGGKWMQMQAVPLRVPSDPWRVVNDGDGGNVGKVIDIPLLPEQRPRQGVNTCGANDLFIFDSRPSDLPTRFLFPLATKDIWKSGDMVPHKWILLPYDSDTGRPLLWAQIERYEQLRRYLVKFRRSLEARKGVLIRSAITKGIWWSLLGVGPYSFAPYKVAWEAYGKSEFKPVILNKVDGQVWQPNQAMQAFIPCWTEADAIRIHQELQHPSIQALLQQLNGSGKCNWAQPGKIKKILSCGKPTYPQF